MFVHCRARVECQRQKHLTKCHNRMEHGLINRDYCQVKRYLEHGDIPYSQEIQFVQSCATIAFGCDVRHFCQHSRFSKYEANKY